MGVKRLSTSSGLLSDTRYRSMLAGYGDFGALQRIGYVAASGSSNTIQFLNIPQTYQDLMLVVYARSTFSNATDLMNITLNNDGSSLYSYTRLQGDGASATSARESNLTLWRQNYSIPAATSTSGIFGSNLVHLLNYANTSTFKSALWRSASDLNGSGLTILTSHLYRSTNAVSRIDITTGNGNFTAGSTIELFGVKASNA